MAPEVQVPTGRVTVFTWGEPLLPVIYNAAYFDEASLVITVPPTPTGAAPTPPPPSPTPVPCAQMHFESDVTIPENSPLAPGTQFVKTWRIKNSGTCAWSGSLNFVGSGSRMDGNSPITLPTVEMGQSVDISLNLVAPNEPGSYLGTWEARTSDGIILGRLLVKINVVSETPTPTSSSKIATATPHPTSQICVLAFEDVDGNGQQEKAEAPLAGVVFTLVGSDGLKEMFVTDSTSEAYCFDHLQPQSYQLIIEPPEDYVETTAKTRTIVLEEGMKSDTSFGARRSELVATSGTSEASIASTSTPTGDENIGVPALEGGVAGTGLSALAIAAVSVIIVWGITIGYLKTRHR